MAGVVYAYFLSFLNPIGAFSLLTSVTIVLSALLGGRGTLWGPVLGAFVVSIGTEVANVYGGGTDSRLLVLGIALVLVVLFLPRGVLPTVAARLARRRAAQQKVEYTDQAGVATARTPIVVSPRVGAGRRASPPRPLLEIKGAKKSFGGLRAVDGVDLTVDAGIDHRAHRAERLGQDDAVQPGHRRHAPGRGRDLVRRHADRPDARRGSAPTSAWAARSRSPGCSRA